MRSRTWISCGALGLLCGCYSGAHADGRDDDTASATGGEEGGDTDGDPSGGDDGPPVPADELGASQMRQLSDWEYRNTITDLFGDAVVSEVEAALGAIPESRVEGGYSTMERSITATHVDAHYTVAVAIASVVSEDPERRAELVPCLGDPADPSACAEELVDAFAPRVYRRPLHDDERDRLLAAFTADGAETLEQSVESVILYMLMAPQFLYRPELDGNDGGEGTIRLTPWEVASRLSYLLWGTMPDDELFAMAADDALDTEGIRAQAERMLASPRARVAVARFASEWLHMSDRPGLSVSDAFLDGVPIDGLRDDMLAEVGHIIDHAVFEQGASFRDLMTTRTGFAHSPGLAAIYGIEAGPEPQQLAASRSGLLTRAGLLLGRGEETHPIVRGAFMAERVLCIELSPPDPSTLPPGALDPPPFDATKTGRARWEEKTSPPSCAACHVIVNPLGFAGEGFDAIGRERELEAIFDPGGELVGELPIDSRASVTLDGELVEVPDLAGLGQALADSEVAPLCFATQWFRYGSGRFESNEDEAAIAALSGADDPLTEMILRFVTAAEFRHVEPAP